MHIVHTLTDTYEKLNISIIIKIQKFDTLIFLENTVTQVILDLHVDRL